jgi:NDP-sugar pyrophosphorylase family protein
VRINNSIIGEKCRILHGVEIPSGTVLGNFCIIGGVPLEIKDSVFNGLIK